MWNGGWVMFVCVSRGEQEATSCVAHAVYSRWGRQTRSPCCSCSGQTLMTSLNNSYSSCRTEIKLKSGYILTSGNVWSTEIKFRKMHRKKCNIFPPHFSTLALTTRNKRNDYYNCKGQEAMHYSSILIIGYDLLYAELNSDETIVDKVHTETCELALWI